MKTTELLEKQAQIVAEVQAPQNKSMAFRRRALQKLEAAKAQVGQLIFGTA